MCSYRVTLTVGHESEARTGSDGAGADYSGETHDWRLYVRGARGEDISSFVSKIVFTLHRSYTYPKRVIHEPPYEIKESGFGCFEVPIYVYIKHSANPRKIKFRYKLLLQSHKPLFGSQRFSHVFDDPSDLVKSCLLKGGARIVEEPPTNSKPDMDPVSKLLSVNLSRVSDAQLKRKYSESISTEAKRRKVDSNEVVPNGETKAEVRTSEATNVLVDHKVSERTVVSSVKKMLAAVEMSAREAELVSQLCLSLRRYEAAATQTSLRLPSFSSPIYRVPELPRSLRGLTPDDETAGHALR